MSGTEVIYNRIQIRDCQTLRFQQDIEYDESGTDKLYDKFLIRVLGTVHDNVDHFHSFGLNGFNPLTSVDAMAYVQHCLNQPRQEFEYIVGGQLLLKAHAMLPPNANPNSTFTDVNNGPKPKVINITRVVGKKLFAVEFEIEICRVFCSPDTSYGAKTGAVLNNRWSYTDERDKDWYSIKTLEGTMRMSHISAAPHLYRALCIPPLQKGYRRESMRFVDSPDGLTLKYQITDRQKYAAPPSPAIDWNATYTESSGTGGAIGIGEIKVELIGSPDTNKQDLLDAALLVIEARMGNIRKTFANYGTGPDSSIIPIHSAVVEYLHENRVSCVLRVQKASATKQVFAADFTKIGEPLSTSIAGYDPGVWPIPQPFDGISPKEMFFKYLQDPCNDAHQVTMVPSAPYSPGIQPTDPNPEIPSGGGTPVGTVQMLTSTTPLSYDQPTGASSIQTGYYPYTYCRVENVYDVQDGYMQLPIARFGGTVPASPLDSCVLIPIHDPVSVRAIIVHAERVGDWPELPEPLIQRLDANNIGMTRIGLKVCTEAPELLADGRTMLYKSQIRINYAMNRAPLTTEILAGGSTPIDRSTPADNQFANKFTTTEYIE